MKVLFPRITCLLTSHMKPTLAEAIESVLAQTAQDFQLLIVDSGQWIANQDHEVGVKIKDAYEKFSFHPLVEWITTGEAPGFIYEECPVGKVFNETVRAGLVRGKYMCTFYDDDLYRPDFFEKMAGYLDENPEIDAVWCTQNLRAVCPDLNAEYSFGMNLQTLNGRITAWSPKLPGQLDCQVDGAQVMWRTEVLDRMEDPWLPEARYDCNHSDGIFLEKLASACRAPIMPIDEPMVTHRATPHSTYRQSGPTGSTIVVESGDGGFRG